ncbi:MAG: acyl-CoA thioesterase [Nannocystaceae bacterium]|nr:acyl-CoA thioesterase [Nannocystaceae bacterium]
MDESPETIDRYPYVVPIATRWSDNDVYGHVNNAIYYSYFDTAANLVLIREGGLDPHTAPVIALVVESHCRYRRPLAYPETIRAGVRVERLGQRAVTWGIAIFDAVDPHAAASGTFAHVFVDREHRRAVAIPPGIRAALERLQAAAAGRQTVRGG